MKKIHKFLLVIFSVLLSSCNNVLIKTISKGYKTISIEIDNKNYFLPSFANNISLHGMKYNIVDNYVDLEEIFLEISKKEKCRDFFSENLFSENLIIILAMSNNKDSYYYDNIDLT